MWHDCEYISMVVSINKRALIILKIWLDDLGYCIFTLLRCCYIYLTVR
jgi:hypothetical protein